MEDTIEDIDMEEKKKANEINFLKSGKTLPYSKVREAMEKQGFNKKTFRKKDRIMDRLTFSLNNHKYNKNRKQCN